MSTFRLSKCRLVDFDYHNVDFWLSKCRHLKKMSLNDKSLIKSMLDGPLIRIRVNPKGIWDRDQRLELRIEDFNLKCT